MKKKVCGKCMDIIKEKDDYVRTSFFTKGTLVHEGYIHKRCNDDMNLQREKSMAMVNKYAAGIFSKLGMDKPQVMEIK